MLHAPTLDGGTWDSASGFFGVGGRRPRCRGQLAVRFAQAQRPEGQDRLPSKSSLFCLIRAPERGWGGWGTEHLIWGG